MRKHSIICWSSESITPHLVSGKIHYTLTRNENKKGKQYLSTYYFENSFDVVNRCESLRNQLPQGSLYHPLRTADLFENGIVEMYLRNIIVE